VVPAVGDTDLSSAGGRTGLSDQRNGLAAFREAQLPRVRVYVDAVCSPERSEEAISAAFVDFLARTGDLGSGDHEPALDRELDHELLGATRSAAAGRFLVVVPQGRPELSLTPECRAMPELLALHANADRPGDEALIAAHLAGCAICAHTLTRMQEAERAFARASSELPALDVEVTTVDTTKVPSRPASRPTTAQAPAVAPARASEAPFASRHNPIPEPENAPRDHPSGSGMPVERGETYRRRSGGLVGAIRKFGRPARG
jgi:hypothetical protein